jgi:DNA invertase Pin-like site-specific DNA recombinase
MAKIGYARVSTVEQNEVRQVEAFRENGVDKWFLDKLSGKDTKRPELQKMIEYVREGDILVVTEFSRLARSTVDLLEIVKQLQDKGVQLVSLKENLDTNTPQGRFMLTMFAALAELERETILQRQREGIEAAKRAGKYNGRQPIKIDETVLRRECQKWRAGDQTAKATMRKLGIKPNTFYRRVKELGL